MSFNADLERYHEAQECEYDRKLDAEFPTEEPPDTDLIDEEKK